MNTQRFTSIIIDKFASRIIAHRKVVIAVFLVIAICCAPMILLVNVNYDLSDYLAKDAKSTQALTIMNAEFTQRISNADVMIYDTSIPDTLAYKQAFKEVPGVSNVTWLDDVIDIHQPLEVADQQIVETYFKAGNSLIQLSVDKGAEKQVIPQLQEIVGSKGAVAGDAATTVAMQQTAVKEVLGAFAILLPAVLIILMLTTSSWLEPVLFLLTIGISIVINMGSNIIFGQISFFSNSVSPILQMAVSLDYAIFLLHAFVRNRKVYPDVNLAMKEAVKESFSTIAASASTTLFGFLALTFMSFLIGADLGINLAKGIVISFLTVVILLPAITLGCYKLLDRTSHRELTPSFAGAAKVFMKVCFPLAIAVAILLVPAYLGQTKTGFLYGKDSVAANSQIGLDKAAIADHFDNSTVMVLLVPIGDVGRELELGQAIEKLEHVTNVVSYATMVGPSIPPEILKSDIIKQFYSKDYARLVVYTDTSSEGDAAFATVENVNATMHQYYPDGAYATGQSATLYDMKTAISGDSIFVNLLAACAIFLVLLVTFRSLLLPLLLVLSIEAAIWINLAIPYFSDTPINFIGYLVLSTVQLGATVDYAILLTTSYIRYRREKPKREAIDAALGTSFKSILVSASVMAICGFALYATTTNAAVADIGILLFRGTLLSMIMAVCFLPALLMIFDKPIAKTMLKSDFYYANKHEFSSDRLIDQHVNR